MSNTKQQFEKDGYLVLENFNSAEACNALMQRAEELANAFEYNGQASIFQTSEQQRSSDDYFLDSGDKISFFFEKDAFDGEGNLKQGLFQSLNKIGHALHDIDPVFRAFSRSAQMQNLVRELEMEDALLIQSMHILKHARIGGVVDIHQDGTFLYTEPQTCVGFWFALEDATTENGCLWAKPGGHRTTLRSRFKRVAGGDTAFEIFDEAPLSMDDMIPLEVKQGTCIVLDGLLPHYSLPNTSGKSRQAYAIHTVKAGALYPADNWLQRDMQQVKGFFA